MNEKQANRLNKTRDELLDELKKQDHLLETLSTTQDPDLNEYQGIFDFSPMPIIICDSQGKTIKPNAAFCKMLGYSSGELTGLTYKNFTHQEDLTEDNRLFAEVQSGLRNSYVFVKRYINKDKSIFWVRINLFKLLTGNDGSWHCIAIVENISHEILAKENLNAAVNDAKKANKSKTDFLATMSHELRTPLNAILGFSDMLQNEFFGPLGGEQYIEYSKIIHESGNHLLALINDILDISAIEAGQLKLNLVSVSLRSIIDDCLKSVAYPARKNKISLEVDTPEVMLPLHADKRALKQIILNLLANAVKFSTRGGSVTIAVSEHDTKTAITVSDTGVGIEEKYLPQITNPFVRAGSNALLSQEGTGLGLSIVKQLVDAHKGELSIESKPGKGTIVKVTLSTNSD